MENYLIELNENIRISERINKGIKKLENEEKPMIQILSYICTINKIKKSMNNYLNEPMKSIKFNYEENDSNIKYEEYYFNGIIIPKNIQFKDIFGKSINISWDIDIKKLVNFDINKIKYRIEGRKENENFEIKYEGNKTNYLIDNLLTNTSYEFRICTIYENILELYSEIHKIKTLIIDSNILNKSGKGNELVHKLYDWIGCQNFELIYRGDFYNKELNSKCDNLNQILTIIKYENNNIFGGYFCISGTEKGDNNTPKQIMLSLTNLLINNIEPTKNNNKSDKEEVYHIGNLDSNSDFTKEDSYPSNGKPKNFIINNNCNQLDLKKILWNCLYITYDKENYLSSVKEIEAYKILDKI